MTKQEKTELCLITGIIHDIQEINTDEKQNKNLEKLVERLTKLLK